MFGFGRKRHPDRHRIPRPSGVVPDFVAVDVETACRSSTATICQIGAVSFKEGEIIGEYEALIDPRHPFDPFCVNIHGIDETSVRGAPTFGRLFWELGSVFGDGLVVSHGSFDRGAIRGACDREGLPMYSAAWLDSSVVARAAWPDLPSHRLNVVADHLEIELKHHDALSDARASGLIVVHAARKLGRAISDFTNLRAERRQAAAQRVRKHKPTGEGALSGHCVCISGDLTIARGDMADMIAAAGGTFASTPSRKTTIMVLGIQDPSTFGGHDKSSKHRKAEELAAAGQPLEIMDEHEFRSRFLMP
jgi:DNA polymerase III subunit epsilon